MRKWMDKGGAKAKRGYTGPTRGVTHRYCIKTAKCRITQTTPCDSPGTLVFWRQVSLVDDPLPLKCALKVTPSPFLTPQFRPTSAHSASTMRDGKKVQLVLIGSRPRVFQWAIDEPCTLPLSPPKGGTKRDFAIFPVKFNFVEKSLLIVSFCESFQWQRCSYIIPLSNGPWRDCGRRPHLPKICAQIDPPLQRAPMLTDFA